MLPSQVKKTQRTSRDPIRKSPVRSLKSTTTKKEQQQPVASLSNGLPPNSSTTRKAQDQVSTPAKISSVDVSCDGVIVLNGKSVMNSPPANPSNAVVPATTNSSKALVDSAPVTRVLMELQCTTQNADEEKSVLERYASRLIETVQVSGGVQIKSRQFEENAVKNTRVVSEEGEEIVAVNEQRYREGEKLTTGSGGEMVQAEYTVNRDETHESTTSTYELVDDRVLKMARTKRRSSAQSLMRSGGPGVKALTEDDTGSPLRIGQEMEGEEESMLTIGFEGNDGGSSDHRGSGTSRARTSVSLDRGSNSASKECSNVSTTFKFNAKQSQAAKENNSSDGKTNEVSEENDAFKSNTREKITSSTTSKEDRGPDMKVDNISANKSKSNGSEKEGTATELASKEVSKKPTTTKPDGSKRVVNDQKNPTNPKSPTKKDDFKVSFNSDTSDSDSLDSEDSEEGGSEKKKATTIQEKKNKEIIQEKVQPVPPFGETMLNASVQKPSESVLDTKEKLLAPVDRVSGSENELSAIAAHHQAFPANEPSANITQNAAIPVQQLQEEACSGNISMAPVASLEVDSAATDSLEPPQQSPSNQSVIDRKKELLELDREIYAFIYGKPPPPTEPCPVIANLLSEQDYVSNSVFTQASSTGNKSDHWKDSSSKNRTGAEVDLESSAQESQGKAGDEQSGEDGLSKDLPGNSALPRGGTSVEQVRRNAESRYYDKFSTISKRPKRGCIVGENMANGTNNSRDGDGDGDFFLANGNIGDERGEVTKEGREETTNYRKMECETEFATVQQSDNIDLGSAMQGRRGLDIPKKKKVPTTTLR